MRVVPQAAPSVPQPVPSGTDTRAKAIAKFNQVTAEMKQQSNPVPNPTQIAPEEMAAIIPPAMPESDEGDNTEPQVAETTAPSEAPKEPLSAQHLALVRREKALRMKAQQQEQALKAREDALKAREEALTSKDSEYKTNYIPKDLVKKNTLQVLSDAGVSYEELTQQILNQGTMDPRTESMIGKLQAEIESLKQANETSQKNSQTQQQQAYDAAVRQIRQDAKTLINSDPAFETVKLTNSIPDVVELITKTYEEDGTLLSVEDAAQQVEDYLIEEAIKLTKINKIRQRLQPAGQPAKSNVQSPASTPKQQQPMKTLTNQNASSRQLSARERALLAFKGELKS